jgi:hypothetical protein
VPLAEFEELATWFKANEGRLAALSRQSSCLLDVGNGRQDTVTNLHCGLEAGPKDIHAGEVAEAVRRVRKRYPAEQ